MRKFSILALALVLLFSATFSNASGAFNGVIKAQVENGNALNSKVSKVSFRFGEGDECLVYGTYADGGFTITLPEKPNEKCLKAISNYPDYYNDSNKNTKFLQSAAVINGLSSNGSFVAKFGLQKVSVDGIAHYKADDGRDIYEIYGYASYVYFWYVDRDHKVFAAPDDGTYTNLELKKGWNTVYKGSDFVVGNVSTSTDKIGNMKWRSFTNVDYAAALQTRFAKGTLGASGKSRPIEMFFQNVYNQSGGIYIIGGKSKTNAAEDIFGGMLTINSEAKGGTCKNDENELKGNYDLTEKESKTSGRFAGTFTACEKNGKLTKASFKGDWIKHSTGNKTPCNFEL